MTPFCSEVMQQWLAKKYSLWASAINHFERFVASAPNNVVSYSHACKADPTDEGILFIHR